MVTRVLLTGGAGFVGSHVAEAILLQTDWHITFLSRLDFAGDLRRLYELERWAEWSRRCEWQWHDLRSPIPESLPAGAHHQIVLHLAAMTHVDRAILDPVGAVLDNVLGTAHALEYARKRDSRFLYFSTDEVFGPALNGELFKEYDSFNPRNPYAATKAGGEELAASYANTYKLRVMVTHTMNVIGERQHREKFVPSIIRKILKKETIFVHSDPISMVPGSRFYIDVKDVADAVIWLLVRWQEWSAMSSDKFNIVGAKEIDNLQMVEMIAEIMGLPFEAKMVDYTDSRPGHDLRYALDGSKLELFGWKPARDIKQTLYRIVPWYLRNQNWLG